jgi:hypothetical protein
MNSELESGWRLMKAKNKALEPIAENSGAN